MKYVNLNIERYINRHKTDDEDKLGIAAAAPNNEDQLLTSAKPPTTHTTFQKSSPESR
jgi:hypothetical protein